MECHEQATASIEKDIEPSQNGAKKADSPLESRRRVVRACDNCRRLKEKCNGGNPCARCLRYGRECQFSDAFKQKRIRPSKRRGNLHGVVSGKGNGHLPLTPDTHYDAERIRALEQIAKHFTGIDRPDQEQLNQAITTLEPSTQAYHDLTLLSPVKQEDIVADSDDEILGNVSPIERSHSGELSHSTFSLAVQQKMRSRLREAVPDKPRTAAAGESFAASSQLRSQDSVVIDAASLFPPIDVAFFLIDVFFEFAQTNYSYFDEQSLRRKVDDFYSSAILLSIDDASWVCTVLMVFAVGTQFAHMDTASYGRPEGENGDEYETSFPDDALALVFYRKATSLIPDIITAASIDSVQAFLLLGIYTLPIDPGGLSCTYFGIAIKLATQAGMQLKHQKYSNIRELELRRRIWWTACTLERRICILHGRHVSIGASDVDSHLPTDLTELRPRERINTFQNTIAMIKLTELLEMARNSIVRLRTAKATDRSLAIQRILQTKRQLYGYWQSLPDTIFCRDLAPGKPLFRFNVHLALTYHLVHIFMGRTFILKDTDPPSDSDRYSSEWPSVRDELVKTCLKSAGSIIDLCQLLQDDIGFARSSYTEFTSCCAALLAILGKRISSDTLQLKEVCNKGIRLLKRMSVGIFSRNSERLAVESLEMAVLKLDNRRREASDEASKRAYLQFRNWVSLQQIGSRESSPRPWQRNDLLLSTLEADGFSPNFAGSQSGDFVINSGCPSFSLGEFASVPGLDEWFEYGLR
ncbi:Fc.00g001090.m01.CDS01 [Cosmosporella sp. VM-42]